MIKNSIFVFSHQDDEFGLYNRIQESLKKNKVYVIYMTSGYFYKIDKNLLSARDKESIKVLTTLGVLKKNIVFFGRRENIFVYKLYKKLDLSYFFLKKFISKVKGDCEIYTHCYEGGNEDHDSCYLIVKKLFNRINKVKKCFQFPLYHAKNTIKPFYKIHDCFKSNGKISILKISLTDKLQYIKKLFVYKSQLKIWVGIFPFLILKILLNKYGKIQLIDNSTFKAYRPHEGELFYERSNRITFSKFLKEAKQFK